MVAYSGFGTKVGVGMASVMASFTLSMVWVCMGTVGVFRVVFGGVFGVVCGWGFSS